MREISDSRNYGRPLSEVIRWHFETRTFDRGEGIYLKDSIVDGTFFLLRGRVWLYELDKRGNTSVVGRCNRPGQIFGEEAIIDNALLRRQSAKAMAPTTTFFVDNQKLGSILRNRPDFSQMCLYQLARQLQILRSQSIVDSQKPTGKRILLLLLDELDGGSESPSLVGLSQTDLADVLGISRESVCKYLSKLEGWGIIEVGRRSIQVKNLEALKKVGLCYSI